MQFILAAAAIGGAGFSVGSLYPRIFAVETTVAKMQPSLERTVIQVERLAAVVDRIEKEKQ